MPRFVDVADLVAPFCDAPTKGALRLTCRGVKVCAIARLCARPLLAIRSRPFTTPAAPLKLHNHRCCCYMQRDVDVYIRILVLRSNAPETPSTTIFDSARFVRTLRIFRLPESVDEWLPNVVGADLPHLVSLGISDDVMEHRLILSDIVKMTTVGRFPSLRHLDLSNSWMDAWSVAQLASGAWPELRSLNLSGTVAAGHPVALRAIAGAAWPRLEELNLEGALIRDGIELARARWPMLKVLNLSQGAGDDFVLRAIAEHADWPLLRELDLSHNSGLTADGMSSLVRARLPKLEVLWLACNFESEAPSDWAEHLADARWPKLRVLDLSTTSLSGMDWVVHARFPELRTLILADNRLTGKDVASIIMRPVAPKLEELDVAFNLLDSAAALLLAAAVYRGRWPQLKHLGVRGNPLGTTGRLLMACVSAPMSPVLIHA